MDAPRLRDGDGGGAEVLVEEPAQVPRRHAHAPGELVHARLVEKTIADQAERTRHTRRFSRPRGRPR